MFFDGYTVFYVYGKF